MPPTSTVTDIQTRLSGRYRIERLLGRGGMGAVHLARDLTLDRLVAVKELPEEFASDPVLRERFLREVRMAASFSHPNIVPVYAVEDDGQSLAFVMGYVEGESLADRVRRSGPLSAREAVRLLLDVAYALAYAHGRGVVHRDIKPDNIMIERTTGRALLMDFGVARSISAAPSAQAGMTRVGEVVGTPEYMSPEQATGEAIDGRSDLYSLGLTAHFAVTGRIAFSGDSAARILVRQLTETLPGITTLRPDLPGVLAAAIDRCLAKEREHRFTDAAALIEALDAAQAAAPEIPLVIRLLANELTMLILLSVFTWLFLIVALSTVIRSERNLDALLPAFVMIAALGGRFFQVRSETRRIRSEGFSSADIHRGLQAVLAEREDRRVQLRADATVVAQRRKTKRIAISMIVGAVACVVAGLSTRHPVDGINRISVLGAALVFTGMLSIGLGIVLLVRSPLESRDEIVFRRLWLGWIGRALFGISPMESVPGTSGASRPAAAKASAPSVRSLLVPQSIAVKSVPPTYNARLDLLEARVEQLERRND